MHYGFSDDQAAATGGRDRLSKPESDFRAVAHVPALAPAKEQCRDRKHDATQLSL